MSLSPGAATRWQAQTRAPARRRCPARWTSVSLPGRRQVREGKPRGRASGAPSSEWEAMRPEQCLMSRLDLSAFSFLPRGCSCHSNPCRFLLCAGCTQLHQLWVRKEQPEANILRKLNSRIIVFQFTAATQNSMEGSLRCNSEGKKADTLRDSSSVKFKVREVSRWGEEAGQWSLFGDGPEWKAGRFSGMGTDV